MTDKTLPKLVVCFEDRFECANTERKYKAPDYVARYFIHDDYNDNAKTKSREVIELIQKVAPSPGDILVPDTNGGKYLRVNSSEAKEDFKELIKSYSKLFKDIYVAGGAKEILFSNVSPVGALNYNNSQNKENREEVDRIWRENSRFHSAFHESEVEEISESERKITPSLKFIEELREVYDTAKKISEAVAEQLENGSLKMEDYWSGTLNGLEKMEIHVKL